MTDYCVVVADATPMNPECQWVLNYSLLGPFPDQQSARDCMAAIPPLKEGGVHTLAQVVDAWKPQGTGSTFVLVVSASQWGTRPTLHSILYGPFSSYQQANDFCKEESGTEGNFELYMGMVLEAVRPS